jgi:ribose 5-phosphate isomerase B
MMSISTPWFIANDHAGYELKQQLILKTEIDWRDLGSKDEERVDYPVFADHLALAIKKEPTARGVLICGSGQGMAIRANKHLHIRAALCWNAEVAKLSRAHNDANVLCLGARLLQSDEAIEIFKVFLHTPFEGGRHQNRVDLLGKETN